MPNEDGYALLRKVRALAPEYGRPHSRHRPDRAPDGAGPPAVAGAGFQSHVPKPVVPEELVEVVASVIHLRKTP